MNLDVLSNRLGVQIEPQLLELALTHRSYSYEHGNQPNNERLEFLGDAVLGFVVTAHIFELLTELPEGELTKVSVGDGACERRAWVRVRGRRLFGTGRVVVCFVSWFF